MMAPKGAIIINNPQKKEYEYLSPCSLYYSKNY